MHYEKRISLDHDFVCIDDTNYLQIIDGKNEKSQQIGKHNLLQESHEY